MMNISGFCQTNYPAKIVWNNDTCVIISIPQLRLINQRLLQRRYLLTQCDSLSIYTEKLKDLIWKKDTMIKSFNNLIASYSEKLDLQIKMNAMYQKEINQLRVSNKKRGAWIWKGVIVGFGVGFATILFLK